MSRRAQASSFLTLIYSILGGLAGLAIAFALFLGPLNPKPQVPFETATGFVVLFFTAVLAYAGVEIGSWMAIRPEPQSLEVDSATQEPLA